MLVETEEISAWKCLDALPRLKHRVRHFGQADGSKCSPKPVSSIDHGVVADRGLES